MITRPVATGPMKQRAAGGLRRMASQMADAFPEMNVHQHLQDAARETDAGRYHSAQRHIHAAIFGLTPLQLRRHGITDDAGHMRGKAFMQQAHRHLLLVKDIEDVRGANDGLAAQRRDERDAETQARAARVAAKAAQNPLPDPKATPETPPARQSPDDPSGPRIASVTVPSPQQKPLAASWEHHLAVIELVAQHESAAGRRSLQKQGKTAYGTSFPVPNVSYLHKALRAVGRVAPGKRGVLKRFLQKRAKQLGVSHHLKGTWADPAVKTMASEIVLANYGIVDEFIELVGPKGYVHGWLKVAGPQPPKVNADKPTADKMSADELRSHLDTYHSGLPAVGRTTKRITRKKDLVALHEQMHRAMEEASSKGRPRPVTEAGVLVDWGLAHTHGVTQKVGKFLDKSLQPGSAVENMFSWEDHLNVLELVGPKGYIHGWIKVAEADASRVNQAFTRAVTGSAVARGERGWSLPARLPTGGDKARLGLIGPAPSKGSLGKGWEPVAEAEASMKAERQRQAKSLSRVLFGKSMSTREARGVASMQGALGKGLGNWKDAVSGLSARQRVLYTQARRRGVSHATAILAAQGQLQFSQPTELSARTAMLERTPAPRGRPGGPGLYDVKGMGHTAYLQQVVKALIEKRGMPPGKAYAIARGAIRRWATGGGKVHPEVRAAAGKAEAGELERQARARASHGHANSWEQAIELTGTAAGAAQDPRTPTGQFGSGSGQQQKMTPHQQHMAHLAVLARQQAAAKAAAAAKKTPAKAAATAQPAWASLSKGDLSKLIGVETSELGQLRALLKQVVAGSVSPSAASTSASSIASKAKSASPTPAAKGAAAISASGAAAAKTGGSTATKAAAAAPTAASMTKQLNSSITSLSSTIALQRKKLATM